MSEVPGEPSWLDGVYGEGSARSLVEGYVHLDLTVLGEGPGAAERAVRTEEEEGWRIRLDDAEVFVPHRAEAEARRDGLTFGTGISELIDPGQWVLLGATYGRRAVEAGLFFAVDPSSDEKYAAIVADWRFAADAAAEALKFVPDGAEELGANSFWTDMGRAAFAREPERFTRARMESDLAYYREGLDGFMDLHAEP
ncbi:hypothetical protein ACFSKW_24155 [Nonomuraea mangrovi]|uniref:Uncharacterized protein n=1 Tax=Nonomuraea mangrovi TaxID=2316207 RepID=A0ABW4SY55_9ACTN